MLRPSISMSLVLAACAAQAGTQETTYGKGISAGDVVKVADLPASPDQYVGKSVRVEGVVTDVCPMRGCWIRLGGAAGAGSTVQFKVPDGEIVFPKTAAGRAAVVEGTLRRVELSKDEAIARQKHLAEEKGEAFDPASVTGPMTIYVMEGSGAVVR